MNDTSSEWRQEAPFAANLGLKVLETSQGSSLLSMDRADHLINRKGDIHGGAISALLDMAISTAIRSALTDFRGISTISLAVNFIAPARGNIRACGKVQRLGRSTAFATAEALDQNGAIVATAQASARIIR